MTRRLCVIGIVAVVMLAVCGSVLAQRSTPVQQLEAQVDRLGVVTQDVLTRIGDLRTRVLALQETGTVSPLAFGAKCDGVTDDTAALRAMILAADTQPYRRIVLPPSVCRFTDTLIFGGHPERYASISMVGHSAYTSQLHYAGPMNRAAVLISHMSAFTWRDLSVTSTAGADFTGHGTAVGIQLDGTAKSGGTMNTTITFAHIGVQGFAIGMLAGDGDSASEIECQQCDFGFNDVGWSAANYNSLNFWFYGLHVHHNRIGVRLGGPWVTDGPQIIGGSSAANSVADFWCGNTFGVLSIQGFRAEVAAGAKFLGWSGACDAVTIRSSVIVGADPNGVVIDLAARTFNLEDSKVTGHILSTGSHQYGSQFRIARTQVSSNGTMYPLRLPVAPVSGGGLWLSLTQNVLPPAVSPFVYADVIQQWLPQ